MIEIIAEISGCHGGVKDNAIELIRLARNSGATGVKFQCFDPERLAARRVKHPRIKSITWPGKPDSYDDTIVGPALAMLYRDTLTPREWFPDLVKEAAACSLTWHASVFDPEDVEFLETLDCPRYKIASFEAHDRDIIAAVIRTGRPIVVSANQNENITPPKGALVLHATDYGVPARDANLERVRFWQRDLIKFGPDLHFRWGLSDHTPTGTAGEIAAVLGARMIEWHIRLSTVHTPDDAFAWTASEFAFRARRVKEIEGWLYGVA